MHWKRRSVLALAGYDSANADYMPLACGQIPGQITVVARTIRVWHQDADVLTDSLRFGVPEWPPRRAAEKLHGSAAIDDDHGIRNCFQDRLQMTLARSQRFFELFLLVAVEHAGAEMTRQAVLILAQATASADPVGDPGSFAQPVGNVEIAAAFDRSPDGLLGPLTVTRFEQGKEEIVTHRIFVGDAEKSPGGRGPDQFLRGEIEVPRSEAGSFDAQPKALVADEVVG